MATREENYDGIVVPALAYLKSALFKIHFWNAGTTDEANAQNGYFDRLLRRKFPKYGVGGKPAGETTVADEVGYLPANFAAVMQELADIKAALRDIKKVS